MRRCIRIWPVIVLTVLVSGVSALAQDSSKDERIDLELSGAPIDAALKTLFSGKGYSYVLDPDVTGYVKDLSLKDVTFEHALRTLLKSVKPPLVHRKEGPVYLISVKKEPVVETTTTTIDTTVVEAPIEAEDVIIEKIPLNFLDAYEVKAMIEGGDVRGYGSAGGYGGYGMGGFGGGYGGFGGGYGGFGGGYGGFGGGGYGGFGGGGYGGFGGGGYGGFGGGGYGGYGGGYGGYGGGYGSYGGGYGGYGGIRSGF